MTCDAEFARNVRFSLAGGDATLQVGDLSGGQRVFAAPVRTALFGEHDPLALSFAQQGALELRERAPETTEGKTWGARDHQARQLLAAPAGDTLKAKRDRATLATLLYHALRRDELCKLKVRDYRQERRGVPLLKVSCKGGKTGTCRCTRRRAG